MRRKPNTLLPLEVALLQTALDLRLEGLDAFHGYLIARAMREREEARSLTGHGTLYKALDRLRTGGLLESTWEDPMDAAEAGRPRRRLYRLTLAGEAALTAALAPREPVVAADLRPGLAS